MKLAETATAVISGHIRVFTAPAESDPLSLDQLTAIIDHKNLIVDSAETVMLGLLSRDFSNYAPYYICIGSGGDTDRDTGFDAGERVPPDVSDTAIRSLVLRIPIIQTDVVDNTVTYTAIARPHQGLTSALNELTLETMNNTLISHYVEQSAPGEVRAKKHVKSSLEYLVIRWSLTFTLN
jgi:hypothetical protein